MSRFELPKEPKFYDYESPITRAVREATETMMKQEEAECMAVITREVGYSVDKSELIKALNYDREQYNKGYRDGVKETFKAELEEIKAELKKYANHEVIAISVAEESGLDIAIGVLERHIKELNTEKTCQNCENNHISPLSREYQCEDCTFDTKSKWKPIKELNNDNRTSRLGKNWNASYN